MTNIVEIQKQIRVAFDPRWPIEGEVVGIERDEDDKIEALLIRAPHVEGGTIYFQTQDLATATISFPAPLSN